MKRSKINWHGDLFGSNDDKLAKLKPIFFTTVATFFWCMTSSCMCGHFDQVTLIGTSIGLFATWSFILRGARKNLAVQITAWIGAA